MPNTDRAPLVQAPCLCRGRNQRCLFCQGEGTVTRVSCRRCGGTGKDGGKCPDCRGHGWRDLDQAQSITPW